MENIDKNLMEEYRGLQKKLHETDICNRCGLLSKPSRQEVLEIVMKQYGEYLATKGMKKLAKMSAALGYTPAELGITGISVSLDGEEEDDTHDDGAPHRYEIFLKSGASRFVTADDIVFDEEVDDSTGDVMKFLNFLLDGRIIAQMDRDTQFIICEDEH